MTFVGDTNMPKTYRGVTSPIGAKDSPGEGDSNRTPGQDQQQPQPNENLQNQPYSSAKGFDRDHQQRQWNDTPPEKGLSEGVTEGSHSPQKAAHGRSGDAASKSATGQPESHDDDHRPPSVKSRKQ